MDAFWPAFLANIAADGIIAFALYFLLTRPDEGRKARSIARQALTLIRQDAELNKQRATTFLAQLTHATATWPQTGVNEHEYRAMFPMHFTRGAWNTVRDEGLLPAAANLDLAYSLFRMNEAAVVANNNLRKLELAILGDSRANVHLLTRTALASVKAFAPLIDDALTSLASAKVPSATLSRMTLRPPPTTEAAPASEETSE